MASAGGSAPVGGGATRAFRKRSFVGDLSWVTVQQKAFTKWANVRLKKGELEEHAIDDIYTELKDGIKLVELCGCLGNTAAQAKGEEKPTPKYNKKPKMRIHCLENLKVAFDYMRDEGVKLVNIGSDDVVDGNDKIILALMWALINHYSVGEIEMDGISGKKGLLLWCQRQTKAYEAVNVKNFHNSWKDGLAFCALLHRFGPEHIPFASLTADNPEKNLELAFRVAEEVHGIERMLDPEDLTECGGRPDEKAIMTYLAEWFKAFAKYMKDEAQCAVIANAIEVTKRHDAWIASYEDAAKSFGEWVRSATARFSNCTEGADGHGDTTSSVKATLDAFYAYTATQKPEKKEALLALCGQFNKLHASQRANDRKLWEPEAELKPAALTAAWDALQGQERRYEDSVRTSYSHFQKLDATISRFHARADRGSAWLSSQQQIFSDSDYGDSINACRALLDTHAMFEQQLDLQARTVDTDLRQAATENGIHYHADAAALQEKFGAIEAQVTATREAGDAYKESVAANLVEHQKIQELVKVEAWMAQHSAVFEAGDCGKTSAQTEHLLTDLAAGFETERVAQAQALKDVQPNPSSPHAGVEQRLAAANDEFARVVAAAAAYKDQLLQRQAELTQLLALIKKYNGSATSFEVACDKQSLELSVEPLADSLDQARALIERFDSVTKPATAALVEQHAAIGELVTSIRSSPEEEAGTAFARFEPDTLVKWLSDVQQLEDAMEQRLRGEGGFLEDENDKEELRQAFAKAASAFKAHCSGLTTDVDAIKQLIDAEPAVPAPDTELPGIITRLEELASSHMAEQEKHMGELQPLSERLAQRGVMHNPHTPDTLYSLKLIGAAATEFLQSNTERAQTALAERERRQKLIQNYELQAQKLREALMSRVDQFSGETRAAAQAVANTADLIRDQLDAHETYKSEQKTALTSSKAEVDRSFAELHTELPTWVPEAEVAPESIAQLWQRLEESEDEHERLTRDRFAVFQQHELKIKKFFGTTARDCRWMKEQRDEVFGSGQYGESAVACSALLDNFNLYSTRMQIVDDVEALRGVAAEVEEHARHADVKAEVAKVEADIAQTKEAAVSYEAMLRATLREFGKLSILLGPEAWIEKENTLFATGAFGTTSLENTQLMESHQQAYNAGLAEQQRAIAQIKRSEVLRKLTGASQQASSGDDDDSGALAPHVGVQDKVLELEESLVALARAEVEYKNKLLARQAELAQVLADVLEYNEQATEFLFSCDTVEEQLATPLIADTLDESEKLHTDYTTECVPALDALAEKLAEVGELAAKLQACEEVEAAGAFTRVRPDDLKQRLEALKASAESKAVEFETFMQQQRDVDALRKRFAEKAGEITQHCEARTAEVAQLAKITPLETAIERVRALRQPVPSESLQALEPVAAKLDEAGIVSNPYTNETIHSVKATEEGLAKVITDTESALQEQLAGEQSLGLSADQFREIKEVFDSFDTDNSGTLDKAEFHLCTTGVGLVLTEAEVQEHLEKLDDSGDGLISFDEFVSFMVEQLSAAGGTSKADITRAWQLLATSALPPPAEGEEPPAEPPTVISKAFVSRAFQDEEITAYLFEHMRPAPEAVAGADDDDIAYEYPPFVDEEFAR